MLHSFLLGLELRKVVGERESLIPDTGLQGDIPSWEMAWGHLHPKGHHVRKLVTWNTQNLDFVFLMHGELEKMRKGSSF